MIYLTDVSIFNKVKEHEGGNGMKAKLIMVGLMVVTVMALLACSATPKEASVQVSTDDFMNQKNISQQVDVPNGGSLTVTLGSNPTTGFKWSEEAQVSDSAVLKQMEHKYVAPDGKLMGAAGDEVWTFKALKKGVATVTLEYSRPWEGGEKGEWTYTLTVTVK
jgi:inhibitor of cysteine peptidase